MGCQKLDINFSHVLEIIHSGKRGYAEKKCVNYYPFGLEHKGYNNIVNGTENNHFTYNGKELEGELGLDWTDYGARRYMRDLGRWASTDPLAEKYETLSPYTYVANNPVNAVDPDGRLIVYVNGLLFDQAAEWKLNPINWLGAAINSKYQYNPERWATKIYRNEFRFNGSQIDYWGNPDNLNSTRGIINNHYKDDNNVFVNGTNHFKSQASDRFALGRKAGVELIAQLQNGTIELENEETIKIVGHSQGAAFAAGMLTELMSSDYAKRVEAGIYLSPHQPGDFAHPDGVLGAQFSTLSDWVSSGGFLSDTGLNGGSEFSKIEGADFLLIRANHDGGKGGHNVETWNEILKMISNFLNDDDEN